MTRRTYIDALRPLILLRVLSLWALFGLSGNLSAQPENRYVGQFDPPFNDVVHSWVSGGDDTSLSDLLEDIATSQGILMSLDDSLADIPFRGQVINEPLIEFWERTCLRYGLLWYYDGLVMHVSRADSAESISVDWADELVDNLFQTLDRAGLYTNQITLVRLVPVRGDAKPRAVIYAHPKLIERVRFLVGQPSEEEAAAEVLDDEFVRMFYKLKFTTVGTGSRGDGGMASLVGEVFGIAVGQAGSASVSAGSGGVSLRRALGNSSETGATSPQSSAGDAATTGGVPAEETPRVVPLPRINTLVVYDRASKIEEYNQVIELLDEPRTMVELRTMIVDVRVEDLRSFGLRNLLTTIDDNTTVRQSNISQGGASLGNFGVSGLIGSTTFAAELDALASQGRAVVTSMPILSTFDGEVAQISRSDTAFASVEGERVAEVFQATVGTSVEILPRIVDFESKTEVELVVNLNDGDFANDSVEGDGSIPNSSSSSITTAARIPLGSSLILGGFVDRRVDSVDSGVPLLKEIPLIGRLFSYVEEGDASFVRLFIIQPSLAQATELAAGDALPTIKHDVERIGRSVIPRELLRRRQRVDQILEPPDPGGSAERR